MVGLVPWREIRGVEPAGPEWVQGSERATDAQTRVHLLARGHAVLAKTVLSVTNMTPWAEPVGSGGPHPESAQSAVCGGQVTWDGVAREEGTGRKDKELREVL